MKTILDQLTEYHARGGLTGDDLSAAVADDANRVQKNANGPIEDEDDISHPFVWADSPEGHEYWSARCPRPYHRAGRRSPTIQPMVD